MQEGDLRRRPLNLPPIGYHAGSLDETVEAPIGKPEGNRLPQQEGDFYGANTGVNYRGRCEADCSCLESETDWASFCSQAAPASFQDSVIVRQTSFSEGRGGLFRARKASNRASNAGAFSGT
jgi:hypothetical protein